VDFNGQCIQPAVTNCYRYVQGTNSCFLCRLPYVSVQGNCLLPSAQGVILNCLSQINGLCQACEFGFKLSSDQLICSFGNSFNLSFLDTNNQRQYLYVDKSTSPAQLKTKTSAGSSDSDLWLAIKLSGTNYDSISVLSGEYDLTAPTSRLGINPTTQGRTYSNYWVADIYSATEVTLQNLSNFLFVQNDQTFGTNAVRFTLTYT
jgi:hypothetical protein